jgi:hypothetical protein
LGVGVGVAGGLELPQLVEGALVGALGGVDAALEAFEVTVAVDEGVAEGGILVGIKEVLDGVFPDLGFHDGEAAELPVVADEGVDKETLLGGGGLEAVEVLGGEGVEVGGLLATDDEGLGVDAGFQGILGRGGLAGGRARAGRFPGVEAVGLDLMDSGHRVRFGEAADVGPPYSPTHRVRGEGGEFRAEWL